MQDGSNVAKEPAACEVEPTKPVCPSLRELGFTIPENDAVSLSQVSLLLIQLLQVPIVLVRESRVLR